MANLRPRQPYERAPSSNPTAIFIESGRRSPNVKSASDKSYTKPERDLATSNPLSCSPESRPIVDSALGKRPRWHHKSWLPWIRMRSRKALAPYIARCRQLKEKWHTLPFVKLVHEAFPGWQLNGVAAISVACVVCCVNFASLMTTVGIAKGRLDDHWVGTLSEGHCGRINRLNEVSHVLLNLLSTVLLASGNYYMQVIASPTRSDVDDAHERGEWCDIGIPSFRNSWQRVIKPWRTVILIGLAMTSLPLHLMWNSMIFYTPTSYLYYVVGVNEDFEHQQGYTPSQFYVDMTKDTQTGKQDVFPAPFDLRELQTDFHDPSRFEELSPYDCIETYAQRNVFDRSDVIVVTEPPSDPKAINETCPMAQGHPYQAPNGAWFVFSCYTDTTNGFSDLCSDDKTPCRLAPNLTACVDTCAANPDCIGASYESKSANLCILKSNVSDLHPASTQMGLRVSEPPLMADNSSVLWVFLAGWGIAPFRWICPNTDGIDRSLSSTICQQRALSSASNWTLNLYNYPRATKCYSKLMPQHCKLQFSVFIGVIVTGFNLIKICLFTLIFLTFRRRTLTVRDSALAPIYDPVLITSGDAIASFLREPDEHTRKMCLAEKVDFENGIWDARWVQLCPIRWRKNHHRSWFRAVGLRRWIMGGLLCVLVPGFALGYFINRLEFASQYYNSAISDLWKSGLGRPDTRYLVGDSFDNRGQDLSSEGTTALQFYGNVILANIPQLFLSVAYVTYNRQLTCMISAREYCQFAQAPQALRVSGHPEPGQKSKHFLALPFWYGASMQIISTLLHWLVSQAIFLANVQVVDYSGNATGWSLSQIGYSPIGLLSLALVGITAACIAFLLGLRRLPADMPLAASCSASISAACQPTDTDRDRVVCHHLSEVSWGVETDDDGQPMLQHREDGRGHTEVVGHCTFTSGKVLPPDRGAKYE